MRLKIVHETAYRYTAPAGRAIQVLRLTPRGFDGQFVINWRIDIDHDCRLTSAADPFGNALHSFTVEGPLPELVITATGEVETQDTKGLVAGQSEPLPAGIFLRETNLTAADSRIRDFAKAAAAEAGNDPLATLHAMMRQLKAMLRFDVDATDAGTTASQAFGLGHGVCQDFAHIFVAAARHLGVPARYVSGYLYRPEHPHDQGAGHAWAEAMVEELGWIGFDPANGVCPAGNHVRLAVGLDYLGAAPVRGTRYGGSGETLSVRVFVAPTG